MTPSSLPKRLSLKLSKDYNSLFVETPRNFITAVIKLRGVSTNKTHYMFYRHANIQRTYQKTISHSQQATTNSNHYYEQQIVTNPYFHNLYLKALCL
jgi:hypothetical protein